MVDSRGVLYSQLLSGQFQGLTWSDEQSTSLYFMSPFEGDGLSNKRVNARQKLCDLNMGSDSDRNCNPDDQTTTFEGRIVSSVAQLVEAINAMVACDKKEDEAKNDTTAYEYYFRGEVKNFNEVDPELCPTELSSYIDRDDKGWRHHEREFYHDAFRLNPECFSSDKTMVERLTRMQHYRLPTRFADLSGNALLAAYFACEDAYDKAKCLLEHGSLRVFKIHPKKMKHFSSDVITAIAHLPLVTDEQFDIGEVPNEVCAYPGMTRLILEICKERPSFSMDGALVERLRSDIQQVWAFKPIWNNDRIRYQEGIFLAFGCGNHKASLESTFSKEDFFRGHIFDKDFSGPSAPSCGIMEVGKVAINRDFKGKILEELRGCGILKELVYPDLSDACKSLAEQEDKSKKQDEKKRELEQIIKSVKKITGQDLKILGPDNDGHYALAIDKNFFVAQSGMAQNNGDDECGDKESFWRGFRKHVCKTRKNAPESFTKDSVLTDRRNWFNTNIGGSVDCGWFDIGYTYTKEKTISIYVCTQNLAVRKVIAAHKSEIDAAVKCVMSNMDSDWESQNFKNRPHGKKRIVFSSDCRADKSDEETYEKMIDWLIALINALKGFVAEDLYYDRQKIDVGVFSKTN